MRKSAPLFCALLLSLSARRAWIEISIRCRFRQCWRVALRKESVDRNRYATGSCWQWLRRSLSARRAWIEILVARPGVDPGGMSLSARRAWIEIQIFLWFGQCFWSLSARRAWIEILPCCGRCPVERSLSARRAWIEIIICPAFAVMPCSRSPQGERG